MKNRKMVKLIGSVVAMAVVCCLANGANANAATVTWTGGTSGIEMDWNTGSNWSTGKVPTADDDVVINNSNKQVGITSEKDISVKSITAASSEHNAFVTTSSNGPSITISTSKVKDVWFSERNGDASATIKPLDGKLLLSGITATGNIVLDLSGGVVDVEGIQAISDDDGELKITGKGTINYNVNDSSKASSVNLVGGKNNDYTGVTNINSVSVAAESLNVFGGSTVNINDGQAKFDFSLLKEAEQDNLNGSTMNNQINITGLKDYHSLEFIGDKNAATRAVVKVPNITLNSETGIQSKYMIIDLAGIKTNGHCVELWADNEVINEGLDKSFVNYPSTICNINNGGSINPSGDNKKYPGVPATAMGWMVKNPIVVAIAGLVTAGAVALLVKKKGVSQK